MKITLLLPRWRPELELRVITGTNDIRYLDFNRFLYCGVPTTQQIHSGHVLHAGRDKHITGLNTLCKEALSSGSVSSSTVVNYYVEIRRYILFCDENNSELFTKKSIVDYCEKIYQRVQRNEIKRTAYSSQTSKLRGVLSLLDIPSSWFDNIAVVSTSCTESYEAYSRSDLNKMLPLLRALFKQTSRQFLQSPDKHRLANSNKSTMTFTWQGKDHPVCGAINKMMSAATFLLAYYTYTNSSQLYHLIRPSQAVFSTKDQWYSMPVFKRRAFKVIHVDMGEHSFQIPKYSMEFFDRLLVVSRCIDSRDGALLLNSCRGKLYKPMSGRMLTEFVNTFFRIQFPVYDNRGRLLRPQISRFRETGSHLTAYFHGDVAAGVALNNTRRIRQRHYSTGNKDENQRMMQEAVSIRSEQARNRSTVTEARSSLGIKVLTLEEYNKRLMPALSASAHGSHCGEPFGEKSQKFTRKASQHQLSGGEKLACADLLQCFGCEHQVIVQSVDDIWCLLSFMACIEESLYLHLDNQHYKKNYEDVITFIDTTILPQISRRIRIKAERKLADTGRHPLWLEAESVILLASGK
ncbi:hypothetical protein EKN38_25200 [Enterobacter sp. WCHEn045836]|uniref:hypothetical protein n=1 Tax=Enterobacter sp. WCHEn045836 TaxID=2497434 RepID=UPI000F81F993|nr:hypothetical protein [Enterobacter sp. WCHEn045836]RTP93725.1 hypothetical protein EKN38_25200 [Enterobacter sp. WCHEn045836]